MAFGFIGPAVKNYLTRRGYIVTRPTAIETSWLRSYWAQWISRDPTLFAAVYLKNRETLRSVPNWIAPDTLARSLWRYGVGEGWVDGTGPRSLERTILADIESEITAADLLAFVARLCLQKLSYLEIGVSVGKNILQIHNQFTAASLVGLDIEEINPVIRQQFDSMEEIWRADTAYPVETLSEGIVQKIARCDRLISRRTGNTLDYVSADQFRDDTWAKLAGQQFNLVFSDGVHTAEALRSELNFLAKYDLIDPSGFIMFWDDLNHPMMQAAFLENAKTLCRMFDRDDSAIAIYMLHGSYGPKRPMGIFSSFR